MSVLWYAPGQVAHLMEYGREPYRFGAGGWQQERRDGWLSPCGYNVFVPGAEHEHVRSSGTHGLPDKRWCRGCVRAARRRVANLCDAGLVAEVPPGTVVQP